jgi:sterol desaturase/sphingolipid hydroxylase (fatty acid hydroxylase superfamily)
MEIFFQAPDLILWAIPAFIVLVVAEAAFSAWDQRELFETKDTFASLAMGVGNVVMNLAGKAMMLAAFWVLYRWTGFFKDELSPLVWWSWPLLFVAEDFSYYWFHRISHECRFFWASHVVHHSSAKYNLATALRQTWTGTVTGTFVFWLWLPVVGFHPIAVLTMQSVSLLYQFWIHTETVRRLPRPVEFVFNTPSHHRVHHGSDVDYLDTNHGGILIVWDRLFGTFQPETRQPTYGLTTPLKSYHPFRIAFHEWADIGRDLRAAPTWRARLGYVFGPPGWSHDGSRMTTQQYREHLRRERGGGDE